MDEGLFAKHIQLVLLRNAGIQSILDCIRETTGVILTQEEVILSGKMVTITTSSVKRSTLLKKGARLALQKAGYIIKG